METTSTAQPRPCSLVSSSSTSSLVHIYQSESPTNLNTPHPSDPHHLKLSRCHTCLTPLSPSTTHLLPANHILSEVGTNLNAPRCSLCLELAQSFHHFRHATPTDKEARQLFLDLEMGVAMVKKRKEKEEDELLKWVLESLDDEVDRLRGMLEVCRPGGEKGAETGEEEREGKSTEEKRKRGSMVEARDVALGRFGEYWSYGEGIMDGGEGVSKR